MDALVDWVEAWISKRFDQGKRWLQWGLCKPLGDLPWLLWCSWEALPPQPVMEGSGRSAYAIPSDGDTPILQFQTSTGDSVRLLIDTGASRSMVSRALISRLQLPTQEISGDNFALAGAGSDCPTDPPRQAVLPTLQLGELKIRELAVLVMPKLGVPPGSDGVLGASALRQLPMLIDPKRNRCVLINSYLVQSAPADAIRLPLQWRDHVPLCRFLIRGAKAAWPCLTQGQKLCLSVCLWRND